MLNQPIDNFTAQATSEKTVQLADLAGKMSYCIFTRKTTPQAAPLKAKILETCTNSLQQPIRLFLVFHETAYALMKTLKPNTASHLSSSATLKKNCANSLR